MRRPQADPAILIRYREDFTENPTHAELELIVAFLPEICEAFSDVLNQEEN